MANRYDWRGHSYTARNDLVGAVYDRGALGHAVKHVTVGGSEMHVTYRDGSVAVYDLATYTQDAGPTAGQEVAEICDLPKLIFAA